MECVCATGYCLACDIHNEDAFPIEQRKETSMAELDDECFPGEIVARMVSRLVWMQGGPLNEKLSTALSALDTNCDCDFCSLDGDDAADLESLFLHTISTKQAVKEIKEYVKALVTKDKKYGCSKCGRRYPKEGGA